MNASNFIARTARRWVMAPGLLAAIMLMAAAAHAGSVVPDGWKAYRANNGIAFAPLGLSQGEKLEIWASNEWFDLQRGGNWASQLPQIRQKAMPGNENCQPPAVESGTAMQTCAAGDAVSQYMLLPVGLSGHYARLLRLHVAGARVMERHRSGIQQTIDLVRQDKLVYVKNELSGQERQASARVAQAVRTAPGRGVQGGAIAAVYVTSKSVESGRRIEHTTWLLLKDGTGYRCQIPPDELDVKASRQLEPQNWVQWRKPWLGGDYEIRGPNDRDWVRLKGWVAQPARAGERLNGVYQHAASWGSAAGYLRTETATMYFSGDGTYKAAFDSHNGSAGAVFSSIVKTHADWTGSSSSSNSLAPATSNSDNPADPGNVSVSTGGTRRGADDGSSRRGRYRLNGWVLELARDDGQVNRYFVTFQDSQRNALDINSKWYGMKKK